MSCALRALCSYVGSTITAEYVANTLGMSRRRASTRLSNLRRAGLLEVEGTIRLMGHGSGKKTMYRDRVRRQE